MKIWGRTNSINVQKVLWAAAEAGVDVELIPAGREFGRVNEDAYAALNPNRTIPVLEDCDTVIWESNAITRYLCAQAGETLLPSDPSKRAEIEMWMDWQQTTLAMGLRPLFKALVRPDAAQGGEGQLAQWKSEVEHALAILNTHLESREWVALDRFTAADIPLGCAAYRWNGMPVERSTLPAYDAWYARLLERPAFQQHVMVPIT